MMLLLIRIDQVITTKDITKVACRVSIPVAILVVITIGILARVLALDMAILIQAGAYHSDMATHIIIVHGTVLIMVMDMDTIMVIMVIILITMIITILPIMEHRIMLPMGIETQFHQTVIMEEEVHQ
jgi:hypothetical protein